MKRDEAESILKRFCDEGEYTNIITVNDDGGWIACLVGPDEPEEEALAYARRLIAITNTRHPTESASLIELLARGAKSAEDGYESMKIRAESYRIQADQCAKDAEGLRKKALGIRLSLGDRYFTGDD